MFRRIALNACAILVGVIISLVFLEVSLRIYNPVVQTVKGERVVLPVNYDEVRKNTGIPGVASESHIHQNSLGFRGAEPPADFADRLTIIAVGGSTTRLAPQSDDLTWAALLGEAAANCFERTWINNAGFEGHTSRAHIDLIRNYINKLHPKVVLLLIGANEIYVDVLNAQDREQVARNMKLLVLPQQIGVRIAVVFHEIRVFLVALAARSEVVNLGLTLYRSSRALREGFNSAPLIEGDAMPEAGEARLAVARDLQPAYAERLRLIIRLLREAQTIPVLMTQPTVGGTGRDPTTGKELSRLWYGLFFQQSFDIYNDTMRQVAQSENVHLIDLARLLPKDTKYYLDIMHYSDVGAAKVAQLITAGLLPYLGKMFPSFDKGTCQLVSGKPG